VTGLDLGLLAPRSVAIVGASDVPGSPGRQAVENLTEYGYTGQVWPVNPRYDSVASQPCYASLTEVPGVPEAVFVLVGAPQVPAMAAAAATLGSRLLVIASSGLGEGPQADGQALAARVQQAVAGHPLRIFGPNTEGLWNVAERCFITFGSALRLMPPVRAGNVAVIAQSGSIGAALGWRLTAAGAGLSYVAMTGNELDLDALDVCELALADRATRVVALFLEGLRDGQRLLRLGAQAAAAGKQIVALKAGRSQQAKLATYSHTGKIASHAAIYDAAFEQAGVLSVDRIEDLVRATATLALEPVRPASGIAVIAVSGGSRAIIADAAARYGYPLQDFAPETEAQLRAVLRDFSSTRNPCDVGGWSFSSVQAARTLLETVLADPNTDSVLVQFASRGREESLTALHALREIRGAAAGPAAKPVVLSLLTEGPSEQARELARELGVQLCTDPTVAVQTLSFLYRRPQAAIAGTLPAPPGPAGLPPGRAAGQVLGWAAATALLDRIGLTVERGQLVSTAEEAAGAAAELGASAYVLKLYPDDVLHKTDVGGVRTGLRDQTEVADAFRQLAGLPGFPGRALLQRQVPAAAEVLVSILRDPDFGPVLCVGPGGVDVETQDQRAYGVLPLDRAQISELVERSGALASGTRAGRENDFDSLVVLIDRLTRSLTGEISTIELNPVLVGAPGQGSAVVDVLLEISESESQERHP